MSEYLQGPHQPRKVGYRIDEACDALGVGRTSIYKLINQRKLKAAKIAGRTIIPATELERLLAESTV